MITGVQVVTAKKVEPFMMDIVKSLYGKDLTNAKYAKYLNEEFAMNYTERDVWLYFEPTVVDEATDLKLIYDTVVK